MRCPQCQEPKIDKGDAGVLCYSIESVGKRLDISKTSVRRLVASGDLFVVKVRGASRVTKESLDRYWAAISVPPDQRPAGQQRAVKELRELLKQRLVRKDG
jgi:excisionase family DNA binding protein